MTKKIYNQPEIQVTSVALTATILTGSSGTMSTFDTITNEQWQFADRVISVYPYIGLATYYEL